MLVLAVAGACSDNPSKPRNESSPAAIAVSEGQGQVGMPGTMLAAPVKARVTNARGNAVANVPVTFTVTRGFGTVTSASVTTDANGEASTSWSLGDGSVRQLLTVQAGSVKQLATARIDTTRLVYLSAPDTVNVGDTVHVWTAVGLAGAPGEAWGSIVSTIGWSDTSSVKALSYSRADTRMEFFNVFGQTLRTLQTAASFPENQASNIDGGPRVFALNFLVKPSASGKDVSFTVGASALVGARTFTDLRSAAGSSVGATVHVR
ncbi:MAG: Ig-like domain-containing protein [Gemmatimonadaceae bacterium]|nr:Ig-like domain-containing protein [Gemmatimonadaceae bacterium]NUQ94795.1 Ig-like domain-containing protein [Gemmatimonadaceae bacterium]NUR20898.1 Ig-like domain-containing protein [Gemmatimonadaceae bacterium]NUS97286.1 Ig-like domain-containing protein [Gemmatimonadaceae bacterium]